MFNNLRWLLITLLLSLTGINFILVGCGKDTEKKNPTVTNLTDNEKISFWSKELWEWKEGDGNNAKKVSKMPEALLGLTELKATEVFIELLLKQPTTFIRHRSAIALGEILDPKAIEPLSISAINDKDPIVRAGSVWALGQLKAKSKLSLIVALTKNESIAIQQHAVNALGEIGDRESLPILNEIINDKTRNQIVIGEAKKAIEKIQKGEVGK
jgi:HEAT repeat protein